FSWSASLSSRNHIPNILVAQHAIEIRKVTAYDLIEPLAQVSQLSFEHRMNFLLLLVRREIAVGDTASEVSHLTDHLPRKACRVLTLAAVLTLNQTVLDVGQFLLEIVGSAFDVRVVGAK